MNKKSISVFNMNGQYQRDVIPPENSKCQFSSPRIIESDHENNLFLIDANNHVYKFENSFLTQTEEYFDENLTIFTLLFGLIVSVLAYRKKK